MTTHAEQALEQTAGLLAQQAVASPARPAITGRELSELLAPITVEVFETEYWGRKPLFIKGGAEKLERILPGGFGLSDFFRGTREAEVQRMQGFRLWAQTLFATTNRPQDMTYIQSDQIEEMFAAGANIASANLSDPRIVILTAALKAQLKIAGDIHYGLMLSPAGNGWPVHVDRSDALSVQCLGRKKFIYSEAPVLAYPRGSIVIASDGSPESFFYDPLPWEEEWRAEMGPLHEVVLEPGDVFYFPIGILHTTEALSEKSLTLNFAFNHPNFLELAVSWLRNRLISDPNWRHLPVLGASRTPSGQVPREMVEFFTARLEELRQELTSLSPDGLPLNREWQKLLAEPGEHIRAQLSRLTEAPDDSLVERTDTLRLTRRAVLSYAEGMEEDGSHTISAFLGDKEISLSDEWVPFLRTMFCTESFVAEAVMQWADGAKPYPWETVQEYLQVLLAQGFLERV